MTFAVALAAFSLSLADPAAARIAPQALEVSLDADRCSFLPRDEVFRLTALELDAAVVTPDRAGVEATRVQVACSTSTEVELTVADRLTGKLLTRRLALGVREPNVAARMVAISVAELVLTSWMELTLPRASAVPHADSPPASPELRLAAKELAQRHLPTSPRTGYVLAFGQAIGPFEGVGMAWGAGLRLGWTPGGARVDDTGVVRRPAFDIELGAARNETSSGLGRVDVSIWSAALRVSLRFVRGRSWLDAGAGGRVGIARLEGVPSDVTTTRGATLAGTWAGPIAYLGVGRRFGRVAAAAGVEGGTVLRQVSGLVDEGSSISVAGYWFSGTLALGWGG